MPRPRCLVLSNGMAGAEKQALALAQAVGLPFSTHPAGLDGSLRRLAPTPLVVHAAARSSAACSAATGTPWPASPHPALAISCGRASIAASVALKAASSGRTLTVHVQRPACAESWFDLVIS